MKQKVIQAVQYDSRSINDPDLIPEYIKDSFIPISSIQKSSPTKNSNVLKLVLINIEVYVLKKDFLSIFDIN